MRMRMSDVCAREEEGYAFDFSHPFYGNQVYMIHCHNLEHEDQGMMLNLKIEG